MDLTGFGGPVWLHSDVTGKEKLKYRFLTCQPLTGDHAAC